jgi:uncharacterized membrane protein (GlpM family)
MLLKDFEAYIKAQDQVSEVFRVSWVLYYYTINLYLIFLSTCVIIIIRSNLTTSNIKAVILKFVWTFMLWLILYWNLQMSKTGTNHE